MEQTRPSPLVLARSAGWLYLGTIAAGIFAEFTRDSMIVTGDATATARNIAASEPLYRATLAADVAGTVCYVGVTALLYLLFKPVNRSLSLLAASFSVVGLGVGATISLTQLATLDFLAGNSYLASFTPSQLQAMAYVFVRLHAQGYNISLVFFGFYCLLLGHLVFYSTFMPRFIGVLLAIAGICYEINSFANFLAPPLAGFLVNFILFPCLIGEGALMLWLIVGRGTFSPRLNR